MQIYFQDKLDEFNRMWNNFGTSNKQNQPHSAKALKSGQDEQKRNELASKPSNGILESNNNQVAKTEKSPSFFSKLFSWLKK